MNTGNNTSISNANISGQTNAYGYEINLRYFDKKEWKKMAGQQNNKIPIENMGILLDIIKSYGVSSTIINKKYDRKPVVPINKIKQKVQNKRCIGDVWQYKLSQQVRLFIAEDKNRLLAYPIAYDHNHSMLKKS